MVFLSWSGDAEFGKETGSFMPIDIIQWSEIDDWEAVQIGSIRSKACLSI
jgi:hypothetical protein